MSTDRDFIINSLAVRMANMNGDGKTDSQNVIDDYKRHARHILNRLEDDGIYTFRGDITFRNRLQEWAKAHSVERSSVAEQLQDAIFAYITDQLAKKEA